MVAFLVIALFIATSLAVVVALADSMVRARNAWKAVRRELAADLARDIPASDGVVVQIRSSRALNDHNGAIQTPHAVAA